jgi:predicted Zn-dependent peptidase
MEKIIHMENLNWIWYISNYSDITREMYRSLIKEHQSSNLTFAVAGDINLDEISEMLEMKFGNWSGDI